MNGAIYIGVGVVALAVIAVALVFASQGRRSWRRISPVASIALALVVTGIVFGESRPTGYAFIGGGVVLAVADILVRSWKQE